MNSKDAKQSSASVKKKIIPTMSGSRIQKANDRGSAGHSKLVVLFWDSLGMHVKCLCDGSCATYQ